MDGYKKVKDNNKSTGKGTIRLQFYTDMDDLRGGQHDIVFPVVVEEGLEVLGHSSSVTPLSDNSCSETTTATPTPPRKRRRVHNERMQFLHVSEEASQWLFEENLAQIKSSQQAFVALKIFAEDVM